MNKPPSPSLLRRPYAQIPGPFGQSAAIDSVGGVAAPLLAGFTFALIGLVLQTRDALRWPDQALAGLMVAALLLITAVQFAFAARRYYLPPGEWESWERLAEAGREDHLRQQIEFFLRKHYSWLSRTRYAYNLGVMALFLAVAVSLVPPGPLTDISRWRLAAIAVALLGFSTEVMWTVHGEVGMWRMRFRNWRTGADRAERETDVATFSLTPDQRDALDRAEASRESRGSNTPQ